jgi:hypothetical protein
MDSRSESLTAGKNRSIQILGVIANLAKQGVAIHVKIGGLPRRACSPSRNDGNAWFSLVYENRVRW